VSPRPLSTLELVQLLLVRFGAQNAAGLARLFAPRVEWRTTGTQFDAWADGSRTRREVESFFLSFFDCLPPEAITVRRLVVDGDDAMVLGRARCRVGSSDHVVALDFVISISVRNGQIDECWLVPDTLAMGLALGRAQLV
jgi:ketosteroid isomerase-like protein